MKKRALIIGSQTGTLAGVERDVERMSAALSDLAFEVELCTEARASRDQILSAYDRLIAGVESDDVVAIYYSGHGNRVANPGGTPEFFQYLVPTDDSPDEFRGILGFELSERLFSLTKITENVTVILDCCHAARLTRGSRRGFVPKSLPAPRMDGLLALAKKARLTLPKTLPANNARAVRVVAAEAETAAYEYEAAPGRKIGAFTEAFLEMLAEAKDQRVTWAAAAIRIRELVMARVEQRPDVEGPRRRLLFSLEESRARPPLSIFFRDGQPMLRAGRLFGAVPGAVYAVMPPGASEDSPATRLARAVVEESVGAVSRVRFEAMRPNAKIADGAAAYPISVPFEKRSVTAPEALRARIEASAFLKLEGTPLIAAVEVAGQEVRVLDPLTKVVIDASEDASELVEVLENMARADALKQLAPGALDVDVTIELGRVDGAARVPITAGDALHPGDRAYVAIESATDHPLYVAVLGIDAQSNVVLLSDVARGVVLDPLQRYVLGERSDGVLEGILLEWPKGMPEDAPRVESLVVVISEEQQDFTQLTTERTKKRSTRAAGGELFLRVIDYELVPQRSA